MFKVMENYGPWSAIVQGNAVATMADYNKPYTTTTSGAAAAALTASERTTDVH